MEKYGKIFSDEKCMKIQHDVKNTEKYGDAKKAGKYGVFFRTANPIRKIRKNTKKYAKIFCKIGPKMRKNTAYFLVRRTQYGKIRKNMEQSGKSCKNNENVRKT